MPGEYRYLLENNIKHLVCLCEKKPPNHDTCPELQLHHIKIQDFTPPSPAQIDRFLSIVEEANAKGEGVAVHCMHGHGRTGTMLACYLVKTRKMSGIDAINEIRRLRSGSIETNEQEKAVPLLELSLHAEPRQTGAFLRHATLLPLQILHLLLHQLLRRMLLLRLPFPGRGVLEGDVFGSLEASITDSASLQEGGERRSGADVSGEGDVDADRLRGGSGGLVLGELVLGELVVGERVPPDAGTAAAAAAAADPLLSL
ncbi:hypothetical protein F7725_008439 [Dissostichus mawsoni]|uniref:Dual specificity protein phosphatase 23 n=1 Tax=Dissostichus mawsoni TaxID=36200 RepID=A0A7J5Y771_DISMA|nr:hypothetical protein F7725_008439 [Dissostichus mawsoni]